jgi:hypothetical protein
MRASHLIASSFILLAATAVPALAQVAGSDSPTAFNPQVTDGYPTTINSQVTEVMSEAEAEELGNPAHNATSSQQQTAVTAQAATTMGVPGLDEIDAASATEPD